MAALQPYRSIRILFILIHLTKSLSLKKEDTKLVVNLLDRTDVLLRVFKK